MCVCSYVRPVQNRTPVTILQHPRERFHPLGTARLLRLGLTRMRLVLAQQGLSRSLERPLVLPQGTALLYPRPNAKVLSELSPAERPTGLLVLDGTWSHAHRLYRDNPWLQTLPHVRLNPQAPSRYRLRKEPKAHCLSTLDSVVQALHALEPDTEGLPGLLQAFDSMIDAQERHGAGRDRAHAKPRRKRPRKRVSRAVPPVLVEQPERVVVVYGESCELSNRLQPREATLLQWVAVRLSDPASCFQALVAPRTGRPSPAHLRRLGLEAVVEPQLQPEAQALQAFARFVRPGDVLASWNASSIRLLATHGAGPERALQLKAAYCNRHGGHCGTLEQVVAVQGLQPLALPLSGRAAQRLAQAHAVARLLRAEPASALAGAAV